MMRSVRGPLLPAVLLALLVSTGATTVPNDVRMPGTQPGETSAIQSVSKCDNCHGNFANPAEPREEPWANWSGGMMAHASRDPVFWATVAIAEQDFDGSGDLCLRCHVAEGWLAGRSTPTDGSGLASGDADGVQCDVCHRLTNPDGSEHVGVQNVPFIANDRGIPPTGFYGSSMYVIWNASSKLGPYADAQPAHQFLASKFHRSSDLCGTCHDVSNPVVGDLAHNFGAQVPLAAGHYSGVPGDSVERKAAFLNPPYRYGVVERTYSEHKASQLSRTRVSDFQSLPADLRVAGGAIQKAYQAALVAGTGGNYEDGTARYFSCQTCHMRPITGQGCDKNPPTRRDLPFHDLTGGNYWVPDVIQYQDARGQLRLGGGLTATQLAAMNDPVVGGKARARQNLQDAASVSVTGNVLRIVNLTGHKLISGYPEGRRMWINVRWYDAASALVAEDGRYGSISASVGGSPTAVDTLIELRPRYTRIYEVHGSMTQEWANQLLGFGLPASLPLSFDRVSGAVVETLGGLAARKPGEHAETFHFVLNNHVARDNRIPPYGLGYDEARIRNILPVPADQYGAPGPGGSYEYWDELTLNPPAGATRAQITLYYQPTSWEYIQFLDLANTGQSAFLANEGVKLRNAWLATGMAAPHAMATATWTSLVPACQDGLDNDGDGLIDLADPGCASAADGSENGADACDDRLDNDGDGARDYPHDRGCASPSSPAEDDGDGIADALDNCPVWPNPSQSDANANGIGNDCECGDQTGDGRVDVLDLVAINLAIFNPGQATPLCDTDDSDTCDVRDIIGANLKIFGRPAYCSRYPPPAAAQ